MHTTFDVHKTQTVLYQLSKNPGGKTSTIVTFEARHKVGHKVTEIFAKQGLDINDFVDNEGNPRIELMEALYDMTHAINKAKKKQTKKAKTVKNQSTKTKNKQKPYGKAKK